jgi:hypothetical protein
MNEELENLVRIRQLKKEPGSKAEFEGMVNSARRLLRDAGNEDLEAESRFDLAYGASHRLALAALRRQGYRSENRYTVFQSLVHTVGTDRVDVQIFSRAHNERNLAEYEGRSEVDRQFLVELIRCATTLEKAVAKLDPPPEE